MEVGANQPALQQDELFEKAHQEMVARVEKFEGQILVAIKGHQAVEDALDELLKVARRRTKNRLFAVKMWKAKGLFVKEMSEEYWHVLKVANDVRSAITHGDRKGVISAKMVELRKALIAANTPEQKPFIEAMTEEQMVMTAFNQCNGNLRLAADRLNQEKG